MLYLPVLIYLLYPLSEQPTATLPVQLIEPMTNVFGLVLLASGKIGMKWREWAFFRTKMGEEGLI